jgi:hypothetical protein
MQKIYENLIDDMFIKFFNQKNLLIGDKEDSTPLKIGGNSFIIDIGSFVYFHFFQDMIGQFLFLRDKVPNLKIVVMASTKEKYIDQSQNSKKLIEECLSSFDIYEKDFLYISEQNVLLENTFWVNSIYNSFITKDKTNKILESKDSDYFEYNIEILKKIKQHYSFLLSDSSSTGKIFISRRRQNSEIRNAKELLDSYKAGLSYEELKNIYTQYGNTAREIELLLGRIIEKFIEKEEEELLESFFVSKGYTIVIPEDLSFSEQINLCSNATHIASIIGSGLLNSIFAKDSSKIFIININNIDRFDYDNICGISTKNIYHIPLITNATMIPNTYELSKEEVDEIIEEFEGSDKKMYNSKTIIDFCEKYLLHIL